MSDEKIDKPDTTDASEAVEITEVNDPGMKAALAQVWRQIPLVPALVGGVAAILLASTATFGWVYYDKYNDLLTQNAMNEQARQEVCGYVDKLVSYDYNNLDPYFEQALAGATGNFKTLLKATSKELKDHLIKGQVKTKTVSTNCGIIDGDGHKAQIAIAVNQLASSVATKGQEQPFQTVMLVTAEKTPTGHWLLSDIQNRSDMQP